MIKDIISFENTIGWEIRYQYITETKEFIKLNFSKNPDGLKFLVNASMVEKEEIKEAIKNPSYSTHTINKNWKRKVFRDAKKILQNL